MRYVFGQFSESFPPIMDGVGNVAKNYAYWLNKKYGSCTVVAPSFPKHVDNEEYEVLRYNSIGVPTRNPYRTGIPTFDVGFMKKVKSIPFDIIHAHTPFSSGRIALDIARKRGIPVIASFHSKYYDDFLESLKFEGAARLMVLKVVEFYNRVDAVWTVNNATADTLREYGYRGNIEIVPNGTEYLPAQDREQAAAMVNEKLNLAGDELVLIYVGQMVWQKNTKTLLEALALLKKAGVKFKMLMVGQGYAWEELKELARTLDLTDSVLFLGAIYDREYLKNLYCRAQLLVFPSLYDNASIVVREAASQSCPALLVEGSNTAEGVEDGVNGFLSKDGAEAISQRIQEIIVRPELLGQVGRNALHTIYTPWEKIVDEVYGRYREIIQTYGRMHA
jgi:glycosyltransferase involved in cell wall biosynthesis